MKFIIKIFSALVGLLLVGVLFFWLHRDAAYYCQRASAEVIKGDFNGALADYDKALKLKPDYIDGYIGRGGAKYKTGDPNGALADYDKAIKLKPDLASIPDLAQTPEAIVTNEIATQAMTLLETKNYDKLEDLATKLRSSKECYADGIWKLACVYDGIVPANRASDEEWGNRLTAIEDWTLARPTSITARVALANVLVAYAWKARGAGETDTVTKEGWRLFGQRLLEAAKILTEAKTLKEQCPQYWRVLMRAALGLQVDKARFNAIFDEAIKFEPDCENYYFRRVIYLLPRWNGSEGEWQSDLINSVDKIGGENGDMLYAQVIWNLNQPAYFKNPFMENNVSWTRVDKGFEVIEKHFPDSLAAKIKRAQFAILFNDAQAAIFNNSGIEKKDRGDLAGAIDDYNRAIEIKPNYAKAYGNRANAKRARGDLEGAMTDYTKAIEIDPDYSLAFCNRAITKQTKGDLVGAMADFNRAIELQPDYATSYYGRGGVKQSHQDYDGAVTDYTEAIKLRPNYAQAYKARGNIKFFKGDKIGATEDLNQAAKFTKTGR